MSRPAPSRYSADGRINRAARVASATRKVDVDQPVTSGAVERVETLAEQRERQARIRSNTRPVYGDDFKIEQQG